MWGEWGQGSYAGGYNIGCPGEARGVRGGAHVYIFIEENNHLAYY